MKKVGIILFFSFLFLGCTDKNSDISPQTKMQITQNNDDFGDFEDEFGDFEDEFTTTQKVYDPLEDYNRFMTNFNDKIYIYILEPTASAYATVVPKGGRVAIKNFLQNIKTPVRLTNNLLQFKFKRAGVEGGRFVVNTLFGLGGFFDPAKSDLGWESYNEDFGQTLGVYGMGNGIPVVLPFFGPSNTRDSIGLVVDSILDPLSYMAHNAMHYKIPQNAEQGLFIKTYDVVNETALRLGQYESIKKDALDLYPFLRDSYIQLREQQIKE